MQTVLALLTVFATLTTEPATKPENDIQQEDVKRLSFAIGQFLAKEVESMSMPFLKQEMMQGVEAGLASGTTKKTLEECIAALEDAQKICYERFAKINLQKSEDFLAKKILEVGISSLENGKILYKTEKTGTSQEKVEKNSVPLVFIEARFFDEAPFMSHEDRLYLEETIPGIREAVIGMCEGEKRTIYIHPNLAYGKEVASSPNALITVNVEVKKAKSLEEDEKVEYPSRELAGYKGKSVDIR